MTDLYLIAHKVRGEPAFDIARRMRCPICQGVGGYNVPDFETGEATDYDGASCDECDGLGYWWISPTWGFRCHPYWSTALATGPDSILFPEGNSEGIIDYPQIPPDWPDLFPNKSSKTSKIDSNLLRELGLDVTAEPLNIKRRSL